MALGSLPPIPSAPRGQSVQDMLLAQAIQGSTPNRAMQSAFDSGVITGDELAASKLTRPNAAVRGFVGGQITPDEFLQTQRIASNPALTQASNVAATSGDDILTQALARNAPSAAASTAANVANTAGLANAYADAYGAGVGALGTVAADAGKGAGFMARLRGGLTPNLTRGSMLRAAGYAGAGLMGRGLVDQMNIGGEGSSWDNMLAGGAAGLGVGAAIGSVIPGIGTGVGAGAGLVVGAALEGLFGDKSNKEDRMQEAYDRTSGVIRDLGNRFGLNEEYMGNIMLSYEAQAQMMMEAGDEAGLKALTEQMKVGLADTMLQYRLEQEMERKQQDRMLAIQNQFAPIFSSIIDRSAINSQAAYGQALAAADNLAATNPQLAELVKMNAANSRSSTDAMMAAYASQAALGMAGSLEEQYAVQANTQPISM